jgi:GT2 family glycosyltransferase
MREHVAVLIVGYRCPAEIRACIEALAHSTFASFEVQICENGGAEAYRALVHELSRSDVLTPFSSAPALGERVTATHRSRLGPGGQQVAVHCARENFGYAGGVNTALDQIGEPDWSAIFILNPDAEVEPAALERLIAHARTGHYGMVGTRLLLADTGTVQLYGGRWRKWLARGFNIGLHAPAGAVPDVEAVERELDYVSGAAMLVTRAFVDAVGRMDESYFLYNEEVDWCFRRGGFRLGYAHHAIVRHGHGATMGSSLVRKERSPLSVYLDERNKLLFSRRFFPAAYPLIAISTFLLNGQYLAEGAYANYVHALRGWWAGLLGRRGAPHLSRARAPRPIDGPLLPEAKP